MDRLSRRGALIGAGAALIAGAAPRRTWAGTEADVIILGAGLAGLTAAAMLEEQGVRVVVLEARARPGGRMATLDDVPGRPESGGLQVGENYARVIDTAARLGVPLDPPEGVLGGFAILAGGRAMAAADWPTASENGTVGPERAVPPYALLESYLRQAPELPALSSWFDPEFSALDLSLAEFLRTKGASPEACRLIEASLNANSADEVSTLHLLRAATAMRYGGRKTFRVRGGSSRLTEAMAAAVKGDIRYNSIATAITVDASGAVVRLSNGKQVRGRTLLSTLPFSVLREIDMDAPLSPAQATAIADLPYVRLSQLHFTVDRPFWEDDGLPRFMWSDGPVDRVFDYGGSNDGKLNAVFWLNGVEADRVDRAPAADIAAELVRDLEASRPAAKGRLTFQKRISWQRDPYARGAYHAWGPGQVSRLASACTQPAGRLSFAGEHTAQLSTGMEGACESGERAALELLAGLPA